MRVHPKKKKGKRKRETQLNVDPNTYFSIRLDTCLCVTFVCFTPFFWHAFQEKITLLQLLFMNSSRNIWLFSTLVGPVHYSRDPQISFFSNFFFKNESHGTIYIFKNYFTIMFSVFSFSKISSIQMDPKYN